ncbi:Cyclic nucleotide-binding domain-containing protein 2 [Entophlyctis sp. JEL0112]|nr:Cyclic nucleotide-binding domain-containing protein 2 [Entophlyctis sp. JEL0112]
MRSRHDDTQSAAGTLFCTASRGTSAGRQSSVRASAKQAASLAHSHLGSLRALPTRPASAFTCPECSNGTTLRGIEDSDSDGGSGIATPFCRDHIAPENSARSVDAKALFDLTEQFLEANNLMPEDFARRKAAFAAKISRNRSLPNASDIRKFKYLAWGETVPITSENESFIQSELSKLLSDETDRVDINQQQIPKASLPKRAVIKDDIELHKGFMEQIDACIGIQKPTRARPLSAPQNSNDNDTPAPESCSVTVTAISKNRAKSKFHQKVSSAYRNKVVQSYFRSQLASSSSGNIAPHSDALSSPPLANANELERFSVDDFLKSFHQSTASNPAKEQPQAVGFVPRPKSTVECFLKSVEKLSFERTEEDLQAIFVTVRKLVAFEKLGDMLLRNLCRVVQYIRVPEKRIIFNQGDSGTAWYIILSGEIMISVSKSGSAFETIPIKKMSAGEGFGDLALINDKPRSATAATLVTTELLKVEKESFNLIVKFSREKETAEIANFFKVLAIFSGWSKSNLFRIASKSNMKTFAEHERIYEDGQDLSTLFFVKTGSVSLIKYVTLSPGTCAPVVVGVMRARQYFGEEAVLQGDEHELDQHPVPAACLAVAGDLSSLSRAQLVRALAARRLPGRAAYAPRIACVVRLSAYEARLSLRHLLALSTSTAATEATAARIHRTRLEQKRWMKLREKEMDALVREQRGDPNASVQKERNAARRKSRPDWH